MSENKNEYDAFDFDSLAWDDDEPSAAQDRSKPLSCVSGVAAQTAYDRLLAQKSNDTTAVPPVEVFTHQIEKMALAGVREGVAALMADLEMTLKGLEGDEFALDIFGATEPADLVRVLVASSGKRGRLFVRTAIDRDSRDDVRANAEISLPVAMGGLLDSALLNASPRSLPRKGQTAQVQA